MLNARLRDYRMIFRHADGSHDTMKVKATCVSDAIGQIRYKYPNAWDCQSTDDMTVEECTAYALKYRQELNKNSAPQSRADSSPVNANNILTNTDGAKVAFYN